MSGGIIRSVEGRTEASRQGGTDCTENRETIRLKCSDMYTVGVMLLRGDIWVTYSP